MSKRILSVLLAICCVLSLIPAAAIPAAAEGETRQFSKPMQVNPLYDDVLDVEDIVPEGEKHLEPTPGEQYSTNGTVGGYAEMPKLNDDFYYHEGQATLVLREAMKQREESILIRFCTYNSDVDEAVLELLANAVEHNGAATEGDYLLWQMAAYGWEGVYGVDGGSYYVEVTYVIEYLTTADQEEKMDAAVSEVLDDLDLYDATAYVKVKGIYDYICENVTYDYENLYDDDYLLKFSAYAALVDGTAVCQGYAVLFYRLALELGVDSRVITGYQTSSGVGHAWNIVGLYDQLYYNLDATWDAGMSQYQFFLKNNDNFPDHTRDAVFGTTTFNSQYMMAGADFDPVITGTWQQFSWIYDAVTGKMVLEGVGEVSRLHSGWAAFRGEVKSVTLGEGITAISDAFYDFWSLRQINLPTTLEAMGVLAIYNCKTNINIYFTGDAPTFETGSLNSEGITAYYPADNTTWTASKLKDYSAHRCEWIPYTPVSIITQPQDAYADEGEKVTVTVEAEGEGLTYQWYFKNEGSKKFSLTTSFKGNTYSTTMNASRSGRQVYCVVTDKYGNSVRSDTVLLCMGPPIVITEQPKNVVVKEGKKAVVTVEAEGEGLTYAWYYKNAGASKFTLTTSFTGNTYSVTMDASREGRQVYCVITDQYGKTVTTDTVTLGMGTALALTAQTPTDVYVYDGETGTVRVEAVGEGLTYAWYYKNPGSDTFKLTTSFTGDTYSVKMDTTRDGRQVYCVITDKYGNSVTTDVATLHRRVRANITKQPVDVTVEEGARAKVTVEAEGDGLTYQWYFKNAGATEFSLTTTFTGNTYSTTMNETRRDRQVYCVVTDAYGNSVQSDIVTLKMMTPLEIVTQPVNVTVEEGEKATVTVGVTGDGLTYTWYYKNAGASKFTRTTAFTGNTYYVTMNEARSSRQVYCVVTDQYGRTVTTNTVTLGMGTALALTAQAPADVYVYDGGTGRVTVEAVGEGLTYAWYYKNPGSNTFKLTTSFTGDTYSVKMDATRDGRQVYCVVMDKYGNSITTDVTTLHRAVAAKIIQQPVDVTVEEGARAKVTVEAEGDGLTYQWYFKNAGAAEFSLTTTFTGNTYSTTMNETRRDRQVYCVITDAYGNSVQSDIVTLKMMTPLEIVTQPVDVTVADGERAAVTVEAEGDGLTFAWYYKNAGASKFSLTTSFTGNRYYITMNESRDGREVYCVITDRYGNTVTTDIATLNLSD